MSNTEQYDNDDQDREEHEIICYFCGEESTIPVDPGRRKKVYCWECFEEVREEKQAKRERRAPRRRHNTRVAFRIECSECGSEDELDYVPKGVSMDEILCTDCFEAKEEAEDKEHSRWKEVREHKNEEQRREWDITCVECGRLDHLPFKPDPNKDYRCTRCFHEHARPQNERLRDKQQVGRGVYIRKNDD